MREKVGIGDEVRGGGEKERITALLVRIQRELARNPIAPGGPRTSVYVT